MEQAHFVHKWAEKWRNRRIFYKKTAKKARKIIGHARDTNLFNLSPKSPEPLQGNGRQTVPLLFKHLKYTFMRWSTLQRGYHVDEINTAEESTLQRNTVFILTITAFRYRRHVPPEKSSGYALDDRWSQSFLFLDGYAHARGSILFIDSVFQNIVYFLEFYIFIYFSLFKIWTVLFLLENSAAFL